MSDPTKRNRFVRFCLAPIPLERLDRPKRFVLRPLTYLITRPVVLAKLTSRNRRTVGRRLLWVTLVGTTLIALFFAVENWRGKRAWQRAVEAYEAGGESLGDELLVRRKIPDSDNFCANELFVDITVSQENGTESAASERLRNFEMWRKGGHAEDRLASRSEDKNRELFFASRPKEQFNFEAGRPLDLTFLHEYYLQTGVLQVSLEPADVHLDVLEAIDQEVGEICRILGEAARRPESSFIDLPEYDPSQPLGLNSQTFAVGFWRLGEVLSYRGRLAIRVGDYEKARECLAIVFKLRQATLSQGQYFDAHFASGHPEAAMPLIWESLEARIWNQEQLIWLQGELAKIDCEKEVLDGWRYTLAYQSRIRSLLKSKGAELLDPDGFRSKRLRELKMKIDLPPDGWIDQNLAEYLRWIHTYVIRPLRDGGFQQLKATAASGKNDLPEGWIGIVPAWAEEVFWINPERGEFWSPLYLAFSHTLCQQAELACALERYFLVHSRYPETLDELVPDMIEASPQDWVDRKPLRYRRTDDGRYLIYSLGRNGSDESGIPGDWNKEGTRRNEDQRDWVWRYSPD